MRANRSYADVPNLPLPVSRGILRPAWRDSYHRIAFTHTALDRERAEIDPEAVPRWLPVLVGISVVTAGMRNDLDVQR